VLASLVAALIASLGLVVVVAHGGWAMRNSAYFTAFAAGVLVTTALMLFPEALAATSYAPLAALLGYLLLYGLNLSFLKASDDGFGQAGVIAPVAAIGLHSFLDGIEYGVLFDHDTRTGIIASVGLIAHEFAEGVILFAVLRGAGVRVWRATLVAFLAAALTTPLGAVASQPLLATLSEAGIGLLLSGAAGALLYVGATHLPTHLRRAGGSPVRFGIVGVYLLGVVLSLGLKAGHGVPGDHHHEADGHLHEAVFLPPDR
jgi:zinc transporter ZupT